MIHFNTILFNVRFKRKEWNDFDGAWRNEQIGNSKMMSILRKIISNSVACCSF